MPPITIAVAAFENDSDANDDGEGDAAQGVFQSLNELNQKLFGRGKALSEGSTSGFRMIKTEFMPKPRVQGGADPGFMQEHENARQWMAEKGVDILIWGKVNAKNRVPTLFLSGSRWQGGSAHFPMSHALTLNPDVSKELWAVLHLAIAAEASEFPSEERVDLFTHLAATNSMASMIQEVGGILESAPLATSLGRANLGQAYWILGRAQRRLAMWLDNKGMLENAIESLRRAENQLGKDAFLMEWSFLQLDRGLLQLESGERLSDETRLKFSGMLFSVALLSVTRELFPMDWAMAQSRMGDAHRLVGEILGEGSFALAYLEEAVVNYKNALQEYTREKAPLAFASAQSGMGMALTRLGELKQESIYLVQGVQAFKQALLVYTRRVTPSEWASNLNNLGIALTRLGEREGGTGHLEEAVEVYRQALLEYTRERAPEAWALTQSNLGAALTSLGEREGGTKRLEQAVEAYEQALLERSEERMPLQWATTMNNLGTAWRTLGVRGKDRIFLCKALGAHLQAWKMASQMGASHYMKVWGGNAEEDFALLEAVGVSDAGPGCGPVVSGEWLSVFPRGSYRK